MPDGRDIARYDLGVDPDPANLRIIHFPDPILRRRAEPVGRVDNGIRAVAGRLIELMIEAEGVGLAAPQVGLPWRVFVAHVPETEGRSASDVPPTASTEPRVFVNPELFDLTGELKTIEEGCLSLPDIRGDIIRSDLASIRAQDLAGRTFTLHAQGMLARCWQHEVDHLDGVLIIHRMTQMSRLKCRSAVRALERQTLTR